jgi:hypothetical protein
MFLNHRDDNSLVEVLNLTELFDPFSDSVEARMHAGEELQDAAPFKKVELTFPSGEPLPRCWTNPTYR